MRVLFDYQAFDLQTHGGVSKCMIELCNHMPSYVRPILGVYESDNVYLKKNGFKAMDTTFRHFMYIEKFKGKRRIFTPYFKMTHRFNYWGNRNQNYSVKLLKDGEFDIFHPTFFDDYFLKHIGNKPFVLTIHDMIPELYPQYFGADDFQIKKKGILAPLAAHIVVPSEQTKKDVKRLLDITDEKISVIYHGSDPALNIKWEKYSPLIQSPYLLYVGSRDKYKNFGYFVKSCLPILSKYSDLKVVCTGSAFDTEEYQLLEERGIEDRFEVRFVETEDEMNSLYHYAVAFIFPSQYEGFGLPILECYRADGLLILNHTSCFPEIAGDAALYFDEDENGCNLANVIETAVTMKREERERQLAKQRERLKLYSWEKAAVQLAEVYRGVAIK